MHFTATHPSMSTLHCYAPLLHSSNPTFIHQSNLFPPFLTVDVPLQTPSRAIVCSCSTRVRAMNSQAPIEVEHYDITDDRDGNDGEDIYEDKEDEFLPPRGGGFRGREEEKDYDRDPEFGEILGTCLDDPQKAKTIMEERLRNKRNKILHTKTGSAMPMKVKFKKFDFSNSYIWFEFYNIPLEKDVTLLCDTIRSWHIVGRLGGCNSLNMQLSQSPMGKRPSYDAIQGANVTPATFYNIGDLEIQDKVARIWVDIGTSEPLILDILINALTQISSDYFGIKQVVFGGSEFENWSENLISEDAGYSVHKI